MFSSIQEQKLIYVWCNMIDRCYRKKHKMYHRYGGRGITVCDAWLHSFETFYSWCISNGYKYEPSANNRNLWSLDRIDNNLGYSPNNCQWVTSKQQSRNTVQNRILIFNNESHTLSEWAEITGFSWRRIQQRLKANWSIERTLTEPINPNKGPHKYRKSHTNNLFSTGLS